MILPPDGILIFLPPLSFEALSFSGSTIALTSSLLTVTLTSTTGRSSIASLALTRLAATIALSLVVLRVHVVPWVGKLRYALKPCRVKKGTLSYLLRPEILVLRRSEKYTIPRHLRVEVIDVLVSHPRRFISVVLYL